MAKPTTGKRKSGSAWSRQIGLRPHTVTAYERTDKRGTVWLRWTSLDKSRTAPDKKSLGFRLRDESGRIDPEREKKALEEAKHAYNRLINGGNPRDSEPETDHRTGANDRDRLTIADGLEQALRVPEGMFAVVNDHVRDMRRYKRYLLMVLTPATTWLELTSVSYEQIWRKLARLKIEKGLGGLRSAELTIVLLTQAGAWLRSAGKLSDAPAKPESGWRAKLVADWHRITAEPADTEPPPRHTPEELGRLLLNVDNPAADPRIRLGFRIGGEARLGQVLRCYRERLVLTPVGAFGCGRITIPGNGRKKGVVIDLTPELRQAIDEELSSGYLRDLEAAYQAGHLTTYPLFPGNRLVRGVARVDVTRPIGKRAASDQWHEFERVAGVEIVRGRGWFGVRRTGADLAEDVESDGRALNAITGHQSDEMRRRIYQQKGRDRVLAKATEAREAARQQAIAAAKAIADGGPTKPTVPSRWEQQREKKRARRRAGHDRTATRAKPAYKPKPCATCGREFVPGGANSKSCETCSPRRVRNRADA